MSTNTLLSILEGFKWFFVAAYVLSTIGVTVGVYWENEKFSKEKQHRGWTLLICALAADTFFTIMVFAIEGWIGHIQRDEIIALESRLAARKLSDSQISAMKRELEKYRGQIFLFDAYSVKEIRNLGAQISSALTGAGWEGRSQPPNAFLRSVVDGVAIYVDEEAPASTKEAAHRLAEMLNGDDIAATEFPRNIPTDKAVIGIQVGIKP